MPVVLLLLFFGSLWGQPTVTVSGTLVEATGSNAVGEVTVAWPTFVAYNGTPVVAGSRVYRPSAGSLSVVVYPGNYTITYRLQNGSTTQMRWIVPVGPPWTKTILEVQTAFAGIPTNYPIPIGLGGTGATVFTADRCVKVNSTGTALEASSAACEAALTFSLPLSRSSNTVSLLTQMSVTSDSSGVKLNNDAASPGNSKYYGTNGSGTKGFHDLPAGGVTSFNSRTGAVSPASADYTASQVTNTPAGNIAATTVQNAINELDTEKAAASHSHAAGDITSGTVATARLGSGTADNTKFLRGDQTWAVPSGGSVNYGCDVTTNSTTVTVATPCVFRIRQAYYSLASSAVWTVSGGGTGTVYVYGSTDGGLTQVTIGEHNVTGSCDADCADVTLASSGFPTDAAKGVVVIGTVAVSSGSVGSFTDMRTALYGAATTCGTAMGCSTGADGKLTLNWAGSAGTGIILAGGTISVDFGSVAGLATSNAFTNANDFSGASTTKPMKTGTSAPGTCAVGEFFFDTDATAGSNVYACTATNTWTLQGGGGSTGCWIDLGAVGMPTEGGAPTTSWTILAGNANVLGFRSSGNTLSADLLFTSSATSSEYAYRRIPFPRNCTPASGFSFEMTWWADANATQRFKIEYTILNSIGTGSNPTSPSWTVVTGASKSVTNTFANMVTDTMSLDLSSCTAGCHVLMRLARDTTVGGNGGGSYIKTIALYK